MTQHQQAVRMSALKPRELLLKMFWESERTNLVMGLQHMMLRWWY